MLTAPLTDSKQYTAITAGVLSRHKAHPCRQVPTILEVGSITNSGNDCRCSLWADATYLGDTLADVALAEDGFDLLVKVSLRAIADSLAAAGFVNERGKILNPKSVAAMLAK